MIDEDALYRLEDVTTAVRDADLLARGWPPVLIKATMDEGWHYAVGLSSGAVIFFGGARIAGEFAHLTDVERIVGIGVAGPSIESTERGLDIRVSSIVWAIDAPHGS